MKALRKSVSRRNLIKGAGAAAGGALATPLVGIPTHRSVAAQESGQLPVPLGEPRFEGTTLTPTADEFLGPLFEWYGDDLTAESGLAFGETVLFPSYTEIESLMPDLIAGGDLPYDLMSYSSVYFGDFVATGQIEPLDRYLEQYQGVDEYLAGVMPAYREFYTKSGGETYGLMCDGDVHVFHYRPSLFNDENLQNQFEQRFNTPLIVPETWEQYNRNRAVLHRGAQGPGHLRHAAPGRASIRLCVLARHCRATRRQVLQRRYGTDDQHAGSRAGA